MPVASDCKRALRSTSGRSIDQVTAFLDGLHFSFGISIPRSATVDPRIPRLDPPHPDSKRALNPLALAPVRQMHGPDLRQLSTLYSPACQLEVHARLHQPDSGPRNT
jgi:hypothetical protein